MEFPCCKADIVVNKCPNIFKKQSSVKCEKNQTQPSVHYWNRLRIVFCIFLHECLLFFVSYRELILCMEKFFYIATIIFFELVVESFLSNRNEIQIQRDTISRNLYI